jgi:hypothetical protein
VSAILSLLIVMCLIAPRALAQAPGEHQHTAAANADSWVWTTDASAFFGYNYQRRQFLDDSSWESQNWLMASVARPAARGHVTIDAMLSLEPFTMAKRGSPQLFQTGESYNGLPLVNRQHPHDLLMALGATYRATTAGVGITLGADLVGTPTLGPVPFMHRESARDNPQVPISHHFLDSTHIAPGVVRFGVDMRGVVLEASAFRGAEPDEDRTNIERPRLDSWAVRAQYVRGSWRAQVSGGRLHRPEWWEAFDESRTTASLSFDRTIGSRAVSATAAWGRNRHHNSFNQHADAFLAEATVRVSERSTVYGRTELAAKNLFPEGPHGPGDVHPHFFQDVTASTMGYVHDVATTQAGRFGVGADVVLYTMPPAIEQFWGGSYSWHVFLRWRPQSAAAHQHH